MKLQAAQRLRSWTVNPITKTSGWRDWVRLKIFPSAEDVISDAEATSDYVHDFRVYKDQVQNYIFLVDTEARALALVFAFSKLHRGLTEELIAVNPKYQGQRLAVDFYEYVLRKYRVLRSDTSLSEGAMILWAALIKRHHGCLEVPLATKTVRVAIHGFEFSNGYLWPVIQRDGQLVSIGRLRQQPLKVAEKKAINNFRYEVRL